MLEENRDHDQIKTNARNVAAATEEIERSKAAAKDIQGDFKLTTGNARMFKRSCLNATQKYKPDKDTTA